MNAILRFSLVNGVLFLFVTGSALRALIFRDKKANRSFFIWWQQICSSWIIRIFGIKILSHERERILDEKGNFLIVCNHQTYVDILVLATLKPCVFVANADIKKSLILGAVTKSGGAVFVERKGKKELVRDIKKIADVLSQGFNVVIFPEGTTSDGVTLLPFKTPLLKAASDAGKDVFPLCIVYRSAGKRRKPEDIIYHSRQGFFSHLFSFVKLDDITADVRFLEKIRVHPGMKRKEISEKAYHVISEIFNKEDS
ncbi:MAG: 1-acyl-sn-glycerol-3-phosphate acyltransferase [Candidatus Aureabacteria bacterium]|nr:1-acyl-sn-glycerol-3-phosphate acyltransferase [Candidatus Auribacterota bacterium]